MRTGPFDTTACRDATLQDLSEENIRQFVRLARRARGFPLPRAAGTKDVLTHLNLVREGRPTHAAVLLFGSAPQRFLLSSEVKCAHFHGTRVAKPIPSYQVYKGTVFDLVDQAVDFVLSKINLAVGTREHSTQAPVAYEMPPEVVREAIVNAVAHRDYTSTAIDNKDYPLQIVRNDSNKIMLSIKVNDPKLISKAYYVLNNRKKELNFINNETLENFKLERGHNNLYLYFFERNGTRNSIIVGIQYHINTAMKRINIQWFK